MKKLIALVLAAMLCMTACIALAADLKIGAVMLGDETEGYTLAHMEGIKQAAAELGLSDSIVWKYKVPEDQTCTDCFCSTVHCICDRCKIFRCLAGCTTDQCNRSNGNTFVDNWDTVFSFDLPCNFCKIFGN